MTYKEYYDIHAPEFTRMFIDTREPIAAYDWMSAHMIILWLDVNPNAIYRRWT